MINKRMSQASIARALGISPATVTKNKAMGMPVYSAGAARRWREEHVKLTMHGAIRQRGAADVCTTPDALPPCLPPDVRELAAVIDGYLDALAEDPAWQWDAPDAELRVAQRMAHDAVNDFDRLARPLRAFMRAVPLADRPRLQLPLDLWDRLLGIEFMALMDEAKDQRTPGEAGSDEIGAEGLGVIYAVACGEMVVLPERAS